MALFDRSCTVRDEACSSAIVTMAVCFIVFEIKRDIGPTTLRIFHSRAGPDRCLTASVHFAESSLFTRSSSASQTDRRTAGQITLAKNKWNAPDTTLLLRVGLDEKLSIIVTWRPVLRLLHARKMTSVSDDGWAEAASWQWRSRTLILADDQSRRWSPSLYVTRRRHQWRSQEFDLGGEGVYVLTSHCNFKTCVNVPHVNNTVTDFGGIYTDIPPVATPLVAMDTASCSDVTFSTCAALATTRGEPCHSLSVVNNFISTMFVLLILLLLLIHVNKLHYPDLLISVVKFGLQQVVEHLLL